MRNIGWYWWIIGAAAGACLWSCSAEQSSVQIPEAIAYKMKAQEAAWNAGDISAFMEKAYWNDQALLFVGSKGPTYGFQATLDNYLKNYASKEEMGKLHFDLIQWKPLGPNHGFLLGSWMLSRNEQLDNLSGHFTLIWERKTSVGWVIIADHSS